jgi:O-antigen/teichoic acid export membrane protein
MAVLRKKTMFGFWSSLSIMVGNTVLVLVVTIVLTRALGPASYGHYSFAMAVAYTLSLPGQFGLSTLIVREVARYDQLQQWAYLKGMLNFGIAGAFTLSAAVALVAGLLLFIFRDRVSVELPGLLFSIPIAALFALALVREGALRGLNAPFQAQFPEKLLQPIIFLGLVATGIAGGTLSVAAALTWQLVAASCAFILGSLLLYRRVPLMVRAARAQYNTRTWIASVIPIALSVGAEAIYVQVNVIFLRFYWTPTDVGLYRIATSLAMQAHFFLVVVNMAVAPLIAKAHVSANRDELQNLARSASRIAILGAIPVVALLILFGRPILALLFGPEYIAAYPALVILAVGQVVMAGAGSVGLILNMTGYERAVAKAFGISLLLNIGLCLLLIPSLGMIGAAISSTAGFAVWNITLVVQIRRRLGINPMAI